MELNVYIKKLFEAAEKAGFEACECYYTSGESMQVSVFQGEIDDYSLAASLGLSFRGLLSGKMGYATTHVLDEASIEWLVDSAKASAELVTTSDKEFLFAGSESYAELNPYNPELEQVTAREKIDAALRLEKQTTAADGRITRVQDCSAFSESSDVRIVNTLGLDVSFKDNSVGAYVSPIAEADGDTSSGFAVKFGRNADILADTAAIADEATGEALSMLGAAPCKSGNYKVLLRCDAMTDMIETFAGMFSAEAAQHGLSLLKGREGEKIAADIVTIMDDPLLEGGMASCPFDSEGVATYTKAVVENGVLTTLLHNLKTAYKQGVTTTGNASKSSLAGKMIVAPTNFFIKPGEQPLDKLVEGVGEGVLITGLMGLHSGANGVSGDFSLGARGYMIEDGKIGRPVKGITVAGNFLKLLSDITAIGSDLWFGMPGGSCCGSPSVVVSGLSVAGE